MYLRRHCYDKFWRCPGWAGGGWRYPKVDRCDGGSLQVHGMTGQPVTDRWWRWRWHRCNRCDVIAIPVITHWLDPTWWRFVLGTWIPRWIDDRREMRKRRRGRVADVDRSN